MPGCLTPDFDAAIQRVSIGTNGFAKKKVVPEVSHCNPGRCSCISYEKRAVVE